VQRVGFNKWLQILMLLTKSSNLLVCGNKLKVTYI